MLHIGCHLSSSKGFLAMGRQALELGADTFQFFTRNPRGSKAKELDPADAAALAALMKNHCFAPIIAHAPYTLNLCGAHKDRHARIGEGCIGQEALARVVNHPALKNLPFCLETPNELPGYAKEIALMRSLAE